MGIQVEFNPDLALRDYSEFEDGNRKEEECIPKDLEAGKVYDFLKKGLRNYWLMGKVPLVKTTGNQNLSRPVASIIIAEATHLLINGELYTKGKYKVIDVFDDSEIHFESYKRMK
jgi:hypothetical protein